MPRSTVPGLTTYDRRIAERLLEIESTPTGRPLVAWVRKHRPRIVFGRPPTGAGFTYPWPLMATPARGRGAARRRRRDA